MKAMILAAGLGKRMRPLTDHTPKPLLEVAGKPLIVYHIERLRAAGYHELVINTHYRADQIHDCLGNGTLFGVDIQYSEEQPQLLETGGGILQALPLLGDHPFCVINGDIWTDHPLQAPTLSAETLAHLVLVKNPEHHPAGDFGLSGQQITNQAQWTFSGIGWYRPELFRHHIPGQFPLAPILRKAADRHQVSGTLFSGTWIDIGTPERLQQVRDSVII